MVIHRVTEVAQGGSEKLFVTKGDANSNPDIEPVFQSQVRGKVVLTIPKLGWAVIAAQSFVRNAWSFLSANVALTALAITSGACIFFGIRLGKNRSVRRWSTRRWRRKGLDSRRIMAPLSLILVIMAVSGFAYAHWSQTIYISGTVTTGTWVKAIVRITPRTLNLNSHGEWMTCHIELPEEYDIADIDVGSILLNDVIPAEPKPVGVGGKKLMVKFSRPALQAIVSVGDVVELKVTGLVNGVPFEGWDNIRVINPVI